MTPLVAPRTPEVTARIRRMGLILCLIIVSLMAASMAYIAHCSRMRS